MTAVLPSGWHIAGQQPPAADGDGGRSYAAARIRQIEHTPKAALARIHAANGGQMGLPTYLKWSKDELVQAVLEDEGIDPWPA